MSETSDERELEPVAARTEPGAPGAERSEPGEQTDGGLSLGKTFALALVVVLLLIGGAVYLLGGAGFLPFNYDGF